jgi:hypothetical protein
MGFSEELIQQVWDKARANNEMDATTWREDECGAWIGRDEYGAPDGEFGWTILNVSGGGPDVLENLRAFHHSNAFDPANRHAKCHMSADRDGVASYGRTFKPRNKKV